MKEGIKEIINHQTIYIATDGTEFTTREECKKYEESAIGVLMVKYKPLLIKSTTEYDLFSVGCDDGDVDVVKITSEAEADVVRQLYYLFNSYVLGDQYADRKADAEDKIKSALEGSGVLIIGRGCSSDECFWIINSKEGLINQLDNICSDNEPIFDR